MDNMYASPGGDSRDWPTQQLGPIDGQHGHAEAAGPEPAGPEPAGPEPAGGASSTAGTRRRRRGLRGGIAAAAAALLVCGGAAAGAALAGGTSPASAGPTGQAALLNTMLSSASSPASAAAAFATKPPAGSPGPAAAARCRGAARQLRAAGRRRAARAVQRACRGRLRRLRVLAGIHGQFTFETKSGARTLAFERGVVQSVSSAAVTVRAPDGTTWTWDLVSSTVVRENGRRAARSGLSAGQHVFVGGPVSGAAKDARLIVIRAARSATGSS